jgi:hypothetical protein
MTRLVLGLLRPYRGWLAVVFAAMLLEIAASLAAPWPLKLVLDDALGKHRLPEWLAWAHDYGFGRHALGVALFAGVATLVIAVIGAIATYIDNYYTTSIGQWVANDLRIRIYEHLHRLSLRFYDTAKTGALMSTITTDDPEFCIVLDAEHHRGRHHHCLHDRLDVLAGLGLHPDRPRHHTLPADGRHAFQKGREGGHADCQGQAERGRRRRSGGAGVGSSRQGIWTTGP